jgi:hypothetical protein
MLLFAYRVYAVTQQNKFIGVTLALAVTVQFCYGIFTVVWAALHPRKFHNHLIVRMRAHRFTVGSFSGINLDPFKFCIYKRSRVVELMYYNLATFFGTPSPSSLQHRFTLGVLTRLTFHTPHLASS